jgi:hypothetical protein
MQELKWQIGWMEEMLLQCKCLFAHSDPMISDKSRHRGMQRDLNRQVTRMDSQLESLVLSRGCKAPEDVPRSGKALKMMNGRFGFLLFFCNV